MILNSTRISVCESCPCRIGDRAVIALGWGPPSESSVNQTLDETYYAHIAMLLLGVSQAGHRLSKRNYVKVAMSELHKSGNPERAGKANSRSIDCETALCYRFIRNKKSSQ